MIYQDELEWVCDICDARFDRPVNALVHDVKLHMEEAPQKLMEAKENSSL